MVITTFLLRLHGTQSELDTKSVVAYPYCSMDARKQEQNDNDTTRWPSFVSCPQSLVSCALCGYMFWCRVLMLVCKPGLFGVFY